MKTSIKLAAWSAGILVVHEVLLRAMANGHVAHSLLASAPSLGSALLAAALVVVRFVAVVLVPGMVATAAVLAVAPYFASSRSTGISVDEDADGVAEGTGTSIGVAGTE